MKIASQLPKGQMNGLDSIGRELVNSPEMSHLVIAEIDCKSIVTETDTGDQEATVRILHVEAIGDDSGNFDVVRAAFEARYKRRTSADQLPFDDEHGDG